MDLPRNSVLFLQILTFLMHSYAKYSQLEIRTLNLYSASGNLLTSSLVSNICPDINDVRTMQCQANALSWTSFITLLWSIFVIIKQTIISFLKPWCEDYNMIYLEHKVHYFSQWKHHASGSYRYKYWYRITKVKRKRRNPCCTHSVRC